MRNGARAVAQTTPKTTVVHIVATLKDGGAEAVVRGLVPRLARQPDLDLHIISIYEPRLSAAEIDALGVPVHSMARSSRRDVSFIPKLISTLRRLRPDIVHGHIHTGKFVGRIAAIAAGVPTIVFTEHGDEATGLVHWAASRILNARTSKFIVFTQEEKRRYSRVESIPLSRISVIANGIATDAATDVDAARAELGRTDDDLAVIVPARLAAQKNQQLVLRAVAMLRPTYGDRLRLYIVGDGPDAAELRLEAERSGLGESVRFLGFRSDARRLTAACDILALPSLWEKMPLVLGEAMLAGVPVVSTPWTGVETFIRDGETGYLSRDWTVEAFAASLARALGDPAARATIAQRAALEARERFDIDRMVDAHAELYREIVSRPRAGSQAPAFDRTGMEARRHA